MEIRLLKKTDYINYLNLMKEFRPIEININYEKFCEIYDNIFKNSEIYIAIIDNKIIGSITIIFEQKFINNCAIYAHIEDVIVDEKYRKNKIGSKLLEYVKNISKEKKCFKCTLVCNKNIEEFYLKNNFEERGVCMSYLINNEK
jgi:glucosamine-phosphate N-acetyltransferase